MLQPNIELQTLDFGVNLNYYADQNGKPVQKWNGQWEPAVNEGDAIGYFRLANPDKVRSSETATLCEDQCIRWVSNYSNSFDEHKGLVFSPNKWEFEEVDKETAVKWWKETNSTALDEDFYEKMKGLRAEPDIERLEQLQGGWQGGATLDMEHHAFLVQRNQRKYWAIYGPLGPDNEDFGWIEVPYDRAQLWHCPYSLF